MGSKRLFSTSLYITPDQHAALLRLSAKTRVPWSVYVREGVDLVLEKYGHLLDEETRVNVMRLAGR